MTNMILTLNSGDIGELVSFSAAKKTGRKVGGRNVTYVLFEIVTEKDIRYALCACEEGYSALYTLSGDRAAAEDMFELICDGEVAPCTLRDVIDDIYSASAE